MTASARAVRARLGDLADAGARVFDGPAVDFASALLDRSEAIAGEPGAQLLARAQERIGSKTWADWQAILAGESEITVEPMLLPGDALVHPQFLALGDSFAQGGVRQLGSLIQQSETPARPGRSTPALGSLERAAWPEPRVSLREAGAAPARGALFEGITLLEPM